MDNRNAPPSRTLAQRSAESRLFLAEALRDARTTGAIAPSSRRLAHLLTTPVRRQADRPLNILEAGAGTGSVTRALIPLLGPGSRLDIVEANPRFAHRLHHLVRTHPHPEAAGRIHVHQALVEHLHTGHRYDVIVSGLPFTNFAPQQVTAIMERYLALLHPGGALTYFAYLATRPARRLLAPPADAARHRTVEHILAGYQHRYATGRWTAWGNLPPARVWQLQAPQPGRPHATVPDDATRPAADA
ncbi:class I SAM-dependent methyltransferase [Streptomyces sp. NPDC050161]|uniref:class I SAM-dependent methyltransferase n=1 Tax=Streptomyces sp. NPDC050161 TaxID=3365604 RepID=UPI0037AB60B3